MTLTAKLTNEPSGPHFRIELEFGVLIFVEEESRRIRRKTALGARTRTNNKLSPHMTPGPGIAPGPQRWEASALTTVPSPLQPFGKPQVSSSLFDRCFEFKGVFKGSCNKIVFIPQYDERAR